MNKKQLMSILLVCLFVFARASISTETITDDIKNQQEGEKPIHKLKTVLECKGDCTIDWQDCVTQCTVGNDAKCYNNCQTLVKKCLDECPNVICHDQCSIDLENCQQINQSNVDCENPFNSCQEDCDNAYIGRTDL